MDKHCERNVVGDIAQSSERCEDAGGGGGLLRWPSSRLGGAKLLLLSLFCRMFCRANHVKEISKTEREGFKGDEDVN